MLYVGALIINYVFSQGTRPKFQINKILTFIDNYFA